jgi:ABC-type phosphate transport system auxiliary subunit
MGSTMSDLTDRLRKNTENSRLWWAKLHTEAADTIDRLQATADNLRKAAEMRVRAHANEIDRLRVTIKMLQDDKAALRETQAKFGQVQHDLLSQIDALREQLALAESVRAAQVAGLTEGAEKLREDAARYRKWRADYTGEGPYTLLSALADAWEPAQVDAAIDAALKGET